MDYPFDGGQTILRYTVVDEKKCPQKENRENFSKMKELLNKVGVYFNIIDGTLILEVSPASSGVGQSQYEKDHQTWRRKKSKRYHSSGL